MKSRKASRPASASTGSEPRKIDATGLRHQSFSQNTDPIQPEGPQLACHPFASLFPSMEGAEFIALVDDIREHGVREPIWIFEGKILDGRNRWRAAHAAGVDCPVREYTGKDPVSFVISLNLKRRHLNESQRAWIAAKLASLRDGQRADRVAGTSIDAASRMLNVGRASVDRARIVQRHAVQEIQDAVEHGHLSVSLAANAVALPSGQQREIAERARAGQANVVRKVIKQHLRQGRELALGDKQLALPTKKYGVILADPEWKFRVRSEAGMDRSADNHYSTSELEEIQARDVPSIAADDCALFLWATVPMLPQALQVMTAWGFTYVSQFAWVKDREGTGYWNRNRHEILLLGTKGRVPAPAPGTQSPSVIFAPVGEHSKKPDAFYELIENYFPPLPKIELNARRARSGWERWGLEATAVDDRDIPDFPHRVAS